MSDEPNVALPDLDELLEQILDLPDTQWRRALDEACVRHPSVAEALRRRFGCLERTGLAAAEAAEWPAPGQRFGAYRLLELVGSGGLGVVYRARRDGIDREVALKVLRPELAAHEVARARFLREASAAARVEHLSVCTLYDFGEHEGMPFLALRFVRGPTLATCIERARRTARLTDLLGPGARDPVRSVVALFARLADGLEEAHRHGLVHRDLKPDNVVLEATDRPVLIDFGLARDTEATRLTRSGEPIGTPAYMAPEQVLGRETDPRTDVYALAATLYECVTLRPPFQIAGRDVLYRAILEHEVVDPRNVNPDVHPDLAVVLIKALQKDPAHRYASMRELGDDLRRIVSGEPVRARPVPWPRRLARHVRRRPGRALAAAAAATGVAVLVLFSQQIGARQRAQAEALAWSTGALRMRDSTVGALVAREAWRQFRDSESTRSNLLQAMARNLQTGEFRLGSLVGGWEPSPDGQVVVGLSDRVWLLDRAELRALPGTGPDSDRSRIYNCAAWSRDGNRFLVGAQDGSLLLFGRDGTRLPMGRTDYAGSWWAGAMLRPMPLIDGTVNGGFVVGDREGGVHLFDHSGRQVSSWKLPDRVSTSLLFVQAARDTPTVLTVDTGGRVLRWHPSHKQPTLLNECGGRAFAAAVSADRSVLAVGDIAGGIHVVHLDRSAPCMHWTPFELATEVLALSADGELLLAAGIDQRWALFRLGPDGHDLIVESRQESNVRSAEFEPDGSRVVMGDHAGRLLVLDRLGRERFKIAGHQDGVGFVRFLHEGRFATGGWDGMVREWRLEIPGLPVLDAHDHAVFRLDWLDDGRHLVTTGGDGKLRLHRVDEGRLAEMRRPEDGRVVFGLAIARDCRRVATGVYGTGTLGVRICGLDPPGEQFGQQVSVSLGREGVRCLAWTRAGTLVAGAGTGRLRILDGESGVIHSELRLTDGSRAHRWDVTHVAVSPDGEYLASASIDGTVRIWSSDGKWLRDLVSGSTPVWSVDFTPDGSQLLIGCADGRVELRDLDGTVLTPFGGVRGRVSCARVSPDGRFVAAVANDGHLHVWTITGNPWLRLQQDSLLHALAFSPDSSQVAVASSDGTVRIWPITEPGIGALASDIFRDLTPEERRNYLGR